MGLVPWTPTRLARYQPTVSTYLSCDHLVEHDPKAPHICGSCGGSIDALGCGVGDGRHPLSCMHVVPADKKKEVMSHV